MHKPTLLLTRPAASSVRFAARLDPAIASRAELLISPLIEIVGVASEVALEGFAGFIFTSANGVAHAPDGKKRSVYCVGNQTAQAAKGKGWKVMSQAQDADALVSTLQRNLVAGPLLHLSGTHQRGDIVERLTRIGIPCERQTIYDQRILPLTEAAQAALCGEGDVVLPLFSPRTAAQFVAQARDTSRIHAIALSRAVAQELTEDSFAEVGTAQAPTGVDMVRAVELLLSRDRLA